MVNGIIHHDVNDRFYYRSNFANGKNGIYFCGTNWFIGGSGTYDEPCAGAAHSRFNTDKCVHNIGFEWVYSDGIVGWPHAGEGLAVKFLYEPGNYRYSLVIKLFSIQKILYK